MNQYKEYQDFIEILKVLIPIYKNKKKSLHIKKILATTIRMLEYVSIRKASKAAQKEANRLGLGNLKAYTWEDQTKKNKMNDKNRRIFHWEHYYPVEQTIKELLSIKKLEEAYIYKVIKKVEIVWILKEENQKLDKIFRSKRPNPGLAYIKAGIKII